MTPAVRIGNCSGFYGDRLSAMHEMLTGGHLDYLTGDYLAELTMLILGSRPDEEHPTAATPRRSCANSSSAWASPRTVASASSPTPAASTPAGLAEAVRALADRLGMR